MHKKIILSLMLANFCFAEGIDEALGGFDDSPEMGISEQNTSSEAYEEESLSFFGDFTGKLTQEASYAYRGNKPHDGFNGLKSSFFLDYEHKFENNAKLKINAKAYYNGLYDLSDEHFSQQELSDQRNEVRLYDFYVEGKLSENLDLKIGRQVVVWGRSDTIRITDVINPLDNRRPGMVDIEDLRLPRVMMKLDYFIDNWRISPLMLIENRFSLNPVYGTAFYPLPIASPEHKSYHDLSYGLSVGAEYSGFDFNVYAARLRDDTGYVQFFPELEIQHDKITMYGAAFNLIEGSWLFKTEVAHFNGLKFTSIFDETFSRTDALMGFEYKGIADTSISFDTSLRHMHAYDDRLSKEYNTLQENTYQHAFRMSSDFMNASLTANYLISLYGKKFDEGGFQRAWVKYALMDAVNLNIGVVDYIGGSDLFDGIKKNDMVFMDISYSF